MGASRTEQIAYFDSGLPLEIVEESLKDALKFFATDIAKHPQVTAEILERLSEYSIPEVQLAVSQNSLTPEDIKLRLLEELSVHPESRKRFQHACIYSRSNGKE